MQRLARCPLLTVHEHDPACSYSQSHDDEDTTIINLLYIRYNIMIARTYYVNFRTHRNSNKVTETVIKRLTEASVYLKV